MFDSQSFLTTNPYSQWQKPTGGVGSSMDMSRVMQGSMNPVNSTWNIPTNTAMPVQPSAVQNSNQVNSNPGGQMGWYSQVQQTSNPQDKYNMYVQQWGQSLMDKWLQNGVMPVRTPGFGKWGDVFGDWKPNSSGSAFQRPPIQLNKPQGQQGNQTTNGLLAFLQQLMGGRR